MRGVLARRIWELECRLNRLLRPAWHDTDAVAYLPRGESRDVLRSSGSRDAGSRRDRAGRDVSSRAAALAPSRVEGAFQAELLVGVTTYGRPAECQSLIEGLERSLRAADLLEGCFLVVVRDTSEHDYTGVIEALQSRFAGRFAFYEGERWLGKPGRYRTYQVLFDCMRGVGAEHALLLEDDVAVPEHFVERALGAYRSISDPNKAVLYLAAFDDDEPGGRWVSFRRRPAAPGVNKTQWFDLHAFLAGRRFFEALDWRLLRPHPWRWAGNANRSSGVSEQFTLRLWGRANIYQVEKTLAFHGKAPSLLNVGARDERALNNFPEADRA